MEYEIFEIGGDSIDKLEELALDAVEDGYNIVRKTIDQWKNGTNTFSDYREVLYGVKVNENIIAIGGINIDPYLMDFDIGRLRHVYVHRDYRQQGIATALLEKILNEYAYHFTVLRLICRNEVAMQLYESYGFKKVVEFKATHIKVVREKYKK